MLVDGISSSCVGMWYTACQIGTVWLTSMQCGEYNVVEGKHAMMSTVHTV